MDPCPPRRVALRLLLQQWSQRDRRGWIRRSRWSCRA